MPLRLDIKRKLTARSDRVKSVDLHPTEPWMLASLYNGSVCVWNHETQTLVKTFEVCDLPVRAAKFVARKNWVVTGADDMQIRVFNYNTLERVHMFEAHSDYIRCIAVHPTQPFILTSSDDMLIKLWDWDKKWSCSQVFEGHTHYVMQIVINPKDNNQFASASLDRTIKVGCLLFVSVLMGFDRTFFPFCWIVLAFDIEVFYYEDEALFHNFHISLVLLLSLASIISRFVVVCGDGEYIIYTAMALRNKSFGSAQEFAWAHDSSEYAIRESNSVVKIFKNFKEKKSFKPDFGAESIYGGFLLGVRSVNGLAFYDWDNTELIRRIEIQPKHIFWSDSGELVCIATEESFFILKYLSEKVLAAQETHEGVTEDGIEDAFEVLGEIQEIVKTGLWVGDCFIYTSSVNRLNYYVGGEIVTIAHLDRTMYLLGYIPKDNRLYLGDKELNIVSYSLLVSVLEYQTAVMRRDFSMADKVLPTIPKEQRTRVAHFLEKQGFKQQALTVSTDPEHRFELALQLGELHIAYQLAVEAESEQKWKQLAELAISKCQFGLAQECLHHAQDYGGLLLLATASGNASMVNKLAEGAERDGKNNVAFMSYFLQGKLDACLELLIRTGRLPEAAFLARTYLPSQVSRVVKLWRENLSKVNQKAAESLADPTEYENLFPGLKEAFVVEEWVKETHADLWPAKQYPLVTPNEERNVMEEAKGFQPSRSAAQQERDGKPASPTPVIVASHTANKEEKSLLELEVDLDNLELEDIDTTDINLDEDILDD
ncbi:coatomer subunit beta' [Leptonychotes weddellii]|uniref:Coatomer subunit beta' n=1 Tax=Leptonychotes weddellii TaxID=9713 RepID=A0A2U3XS27_LEPWE|nr:coatomer subunit beta' [Leptonychotes weddellii]